MNSRKPKDRPATGQITARFDAVTDVVFCTDTRYLVEYISVALASHFRKSLRSGTRADGKGPLPRISNRTKARRQSTGGPGLDTVGVVTGELADSWMLRRIEGDETSASRGIDPYGAPDREWAILYLLGYGIQSTDGAAADVIEAATGQFLDDMGGEKIALPAGLALAPTPIKRSRLAKR